MGIRFLYPGERNHFYALCLAFVRPLLRNSGLIKPSLHCQGDRPAVATRDRRQSGLGPKRVDPAGRDF